MQRRFEERIEPAYERRTASRLFRPSLRAGDAALCPLRAFADDAEQVVGHRTHARDSMSADIRAGERALRALYFIDPQLKGGR